MFYRTVSSFVLAGVLLMGAPALASEDASSSASFGERCEARHAKLSERLQNGEDRKAAAEARYTERLEKLYALINEASEAGIDTSDLEGYAEELESLHEEMVSAMEALVAHWSEVLAVDCDDMTAEVAAAFREEAKELHTAVREARDAFKSFVKETLRPEIQSIREAMTE